MGLSWTLRLGSLVRLANRAVSCFIFLALNFKSIFHNQTVKWSPAHWWELGMEPIAGGACLTKCRLNIEMNRDESREILFHLLHYKWTHSQYLRGSCVHLGLHAQFPAELSPWQSFQSKGSATQINWRHRTERHHPSCPVSASPNAERHAADVRSCAL